MYHVMFWNKTYHSSPKKKKGKMSREPKSKTSMVFGFSIN